MKLKTLLMVGLFVPAVSFIQSCSKPCENVVCQNGGQCMEGTCDCPEGYSGEFCETEDLAIGMEHEGGIIFCIFQPGDPHYVQGETHGLVASLNDIGNTIKWGCTGDDIPGVPNVTSDPPTGPGADVGDGESNTLVISSHPCQVNDLLMTAPKKCADYVYSSYDDWYLPTVNELELMHANIGPGASGENYNIGGFYGLGYYWSSTEYDANNAWSYQFTTGGAVDILKFSNSNTTRVRAARRF